MYVKRAAIRKRHPAIDDIRHFWHRNSLDRRPVEADVHSRNQRRMEPHCYFFAQFFVVSLVLTKFGYSDFSASRGSDCNGNDLRIGYLPTSAPLDILPINSKN